MPLSPPKNRTGFALAVLFVVGAITCADILAITLLGSNANSTFQFVGATTRPPTRPLEVAPPPRPGAELKEYTLPFDPNSAIGGFLVADLRVDVIAALRCGERTRVLRAVENVRVVKTKTDDMGRASVALAITDEQARVLDRAAFRGCELTLIMRNEKKPLDPDYDLGAVLDSLALPVAPAPRPAGERP